MAPPLSGVYPTKTVKLYKEYRDALIAKYREDPRRRLTCTAARQVGRGAGRTSGVQQGLLHLVDPPPPRRYIIIIINY